MKLLTLAFIALCFTQYAKADNVTLTEDNHCYLDEAVTSDSMYELKQCLAKKVIKRGSKKNKLYLVIDSPGGNIYAGLSFIEFAETIRGLETVTIFGASMASAIAQGLPGRRHITRNGIMMFHRAKGQFSGQFGDGELEQQLALWKHIVAKMEIRSSNRIGISHGKYKKLVKDEWWLYGDQNTKQKTADTVSKVVCSAKLAASKRKKKVNTFLGPVEYEVSNCPMMN
jgi:ATP-dependent protease ClpP protease subunit